jgi:hypothetical protein
VWHVSVQPCSDGRRQRQEEAEAKAQAQTDKESPEGEEGKEKEEEGAKKKEKKWGFEAKGLPATRAALQQYVDAPIPAELVGRKWYVEPSSWPNPHEAHQRPSGGLPRLPNFDGMDDENWAELGHAYGSGTAPTTNHPLFVFVLKGTDRQRVPVWGWSVGCARTAAAADLPPLIRGLASRSRKVQERCIGTLYGNAIHQGTRGV